MKPGALLGERFVIEAHACTGGMGSVYRARDRERGDALVALKVMTDDERGLGPRFAREASVLAELDHPGIVRYVAHGMSSAGSGSSTYLAMEWLEGEDLASHLARAHTHRIDVASAVVIARRAAEALAAAHERGIVHRDIKPSNLFLVEQDPRRLKVLDFGVARVTGSVAPFGPTERPITRTGAIVGTVGYMAPEQARGDRDVDPRADVFSLGCVLFECLTGRPAFSGAHIVAVLAKILLEDAPRAASFNDAVSPALDELVSRMLAKDPFVRPADAQALLRELDRLTLCHPSPAARAPRESHPPLADREQRLVTIVFARTGDVVHARKIVEPFGGSTIVLADGTLLVTFAGLGSATDQVTRAASYALALYGIAPAARIAIATGRAESTGEGIYGPTVDRAAASLARAERIRGVVVDDTSAGLLEGRFDVVRHEEGDVLVVREPIVERLAPRTLLGRSTPCVGRDKELALLEATFDECASEPVARTALITGVAGTGKSRLCHELITRLHGRGNDVHVLFARGEPVGAGAALTLARQLVRSALAAHESLVDHLDALMRSDDRRSAIADMLRELVGQPTKDPGPQLRAARNDPMIMASAMRHAFSEWLGALACREPVLVIIEDMHWGDAGSISLLGAALATHTSKPLMVLALARPEVHDSFPRLWAQSTPQEIRLARLTRSASEKLARLALPEASDDLITRLVAQADGNAFYLEELVRHVARCGDIAFPDTVVALAQSRLEALEPDARRVLRLASIFGEIFWREGVDALAPDIVTEPIFHALIAGEVLVERSTARLGSRRELGFRHSLLREAAYSMLTEPDRRSGHLLVGAWLESLAIEEPLVLVEHFERGGDMQRALPYIVRASRDALAIGQMVGGAALARRGLDAKAEGVLRGQLLTVVAVGASAQGRFEEAKAMALEARDLLPRGGVDWFIAIAALMSSAFRSQDFSVMPALVHDVVSLPHDPDPIGPYGAALFMLAEILDNVDQGEVASMLIERAERVGERGVNPDPIFVAYVAVARGAALYRRGQPIGEVYRLLDTAIAAVSHVPAGARPGQLLFVEGCLCIERGDLEGGRKLLESAESVLVQDGALLYVGWCRIHLGWAAVFEGRFTEALALAEPLMDGGDSRHAKALVAMALLGLGRTDEAERFSREAIHGVEHELLTPWVVTVLRAARAEVLLTLQRAGEALACAEVPASPAARVLSPFLLLLTARMRAARDAKEVAVAKEVAREVTTFLDQQALSLEGERRALFLRAPNCVRALAIAQSILEEESAPA